MTPTKVTPSQARRAAVLWTSIIVGLLSLQVSLCAWGVYCATKDKNATIEEDYYNKALHWDELHKGQSK